jgi:hypothetical protein
MVESKVSKLNPFAANPDLAHRICAETVDQFAPVGRFKGQEIRSQARFKASRVDKSNCTRCIYGAGDERLSRSQSIQPDGECKCGLRGI